MRGPWSLKAFAGAALVLLGGLVLTGWIAGWQRPIAPFGAGMAPNTALCFLLAGGALLSAGRRSAPAWAVALLAVAGATLLQYLLDADFGIDTLIAGDPQDLVRTPHPGRMTMATALSFVLAALSLLSRVGAVQVATSLAMVANVLLGVLALAFNSPSFPAFGVYAGTAPHTLAGLLVLGATLLFSLSRAVLGAWSRQSVRRQLSLLALVAALPFVAFAGLLLYLGAAEVEAQALAAASGQVEKLAAGIEDALYQPRRGLESLAGHPMVQRMDPSQCDPALASVAASLAAVVQIVQVDPAGQGFCQTSRSGLKVNYADRDWFRAGMTADSFELGEPVFGRATQRVVVSATQPVWAGRGTRAGMLAAGLDLGPTISGARAFHLPEGTVTTLVSRKGRVISRSLDNEKWAGRDVADHPLVARQRSLANGALVAQGLDGVARIHAFRTLSSTGWLVSVAIPVSEVTGPPTQRLRSAAALAMAVLLATVALAVWLGGRLGQPLARLARAATAVADGGRGEDLAEEGARELAMAARAFNAMKASRAQAQDSLAQRNAQLDAANKELEAFAYSVSHDLRAPLRAIDGFSLALQEDHAAQLDHQAHRYLQRVREAAQRMASLIDDMLELSRSTRGEVRIERVDVSELARAAAEDLLAGVAQPPRLEIERGVVAMADKSLLRAVLDNLLSNAIKFTAKTAAPRIDFRAERTEAGRVVCTVEDNGAGFDEAYAANLFSPFFRLHRADEFPGNGIGLATVKRIVARMGGEVWARGEPGRGAAFSFSLRTPESGDTP